MARTDHLTGMPNRLAFEELFDRQVTCALRTNRPFALLLADLDRFKELNDRLGHAAGDAALAELGRLFSAELAATILPRVWAATSSRCCCPRPTATAPGRPAIESPGPCSNGCVRAERR